LSPIMRMLSDFGQGTNKSLIGQLIQLYDPIQGDFKDKFGRRISGRAAQRLFSSDTWFFLHHSGTHAVQVETMLALLMEKKV